MTTRSRPQAVHAVTRHATSFVLCAALLFACGREVSIEASGDGGAESGPDAGPARTLEECGLLGDYRVTDAGRGCTEWPLADESIVLVREGGRAVLRAGTMELPLGEPSDDCRAVAAGCADDSQRYFAPRFEVTRTATGLRLEADAVDVVEHRVGPCSAASFEAARILPCDPVGQYRAEQAVLTSGACDLTWGPGKVVIEQTDGGFKVGWTGVDFKEVTLDEQTCTLTGSEGAGDAWWLFNGARRSATLELKVERDTVQGTATDHLVSATFDGKTCQNAVFAISASRPASREAQRFEPTCATPPPSACGNGVCEADETCRCSDCTCDEGHVCAPDQTCRLPCTLLSESEACGDGRCSAVGKSDCRRLDKTDSLYCEAQGAAVPGQPCLCNSDCVAGSICHVPQNGKGQSLCALPCGEGFPECLADQRCSYHGGSGGYYPAAQRACESFAGFGDDCATLACNTGLHCIKQCVNDVCRQFCTRPCSAGCAEPLPICGALSYCGPAS